MIVWELITLSRTNALKIEIIIRLRPQVECQNIQFNFDYLMSNGTFKLWINSDISYGPIYTWDHFSYNG